MGKGKNSPIGDKQFTTYFTRYAHPIEYLKQEPVTENLGIIVTIPCFNEPDLHKTLNSIDHCYLTRNPVEIIILINQPENALPEISSQNERTFSDTINWIEKHSSPDKKYHVIWVKDIPEKQAGVGLARKIVMDEAVRRLYKSGAINGIITGLDADTQCDPNYLCEIEDYFEKYPDTTGGHVYFEHPFILNDNNEHVPGIVSYELHLRILIHALRYAQFPYAFHTLGSSMVVRADIYAKQGGMNKRQAGEDFYFLHKIIPLGNFCEINTTRVLPSNRISDRVPFGTGKAMMKWSESNSNIYRTYNPEIFEIIKRLLQDIEKLFKAGNPHIGTYYDNQSVCFKKFIPKHQWIDKINSLNKQSTTLSTFRYKFFQWFNALKILRFIHYTRDIMYENVPVLVAYDWLVGRIELDKDVSSEYEALDHLRIYDRENPYVFRK